MFISIILAAGGLGLRMGLQTPKQYLTLREKPIALHSFELLCALPEACEIIVICDKEYRTLFSSHKPLKFALPGERRQDSIYNALQLVSKESELLCIHDAARPFLDEPSLKSVIEEGKIHGASVLAVPVKYTIKQGSSQEFVATTLDRTTLWEIQTPQVMRPSLLKNGYAIASEKNLNVTDDVSLVELTGHPVKLVKGSYRNFKITTPEDLTLAQTLV